MHNVIEYIIITITLALVGAGVWNETVSASSRAAASALVAVQLDAAQEVLAKELAKGPVPSDSPLVTKVYQLGVEICRVGGGSYCGPYHGSRALDKVRHLAVMMR